LNVVLRSPRSQRTSVELHRKFHFLLLKGFYLFSRRFQSTAEKTHFFKNIYRQGGKLFVSAW